MFACGTDSFGRMRLAVADYRDIPWHSRNLVFNKLYTWLVLARLADTTPIHELPGITERLWPGLPGPVVFAVLCTRCLIVFVRLPFTPAAPTEVSIRCRRLGHCHQNGPTTVKQANTIKTCH